MASLIATGCTYNERKALRSYETQVESIHPTVDELRRNQARIADRGTPEKIRSYVSSEILPHAHHVTQSLREIRTHHPELARLHQEWLALWIDYEEQFEIFVEDLDEHSLSEKERRLGIALEQITERMRSWQNRLQEIHDQHKG